MGSRDEIESILRTKLARAGRCQQDAAIQYRRILDELAHGSASSTDIDRLEEAAKTETAARAAMWKASVRLTDFLVEGKIPNDLQGCSQLGPDVDPPANPVGGSALIAVTR